MLERMTPVENVESVDMSRDPAVTRYAELAASLGGRWGEVVVLDQHGYVVLGKRRLERAHRASELCVPTVRIETTDEEARLLRLADFCEGDGMFVLQLERLVNELKEAA